MWSSVLLPSGSPALDSAWPADGCAAKWSESSSSSPCSCSPTRSSGSPSTSDSGTPSVMCSSSARGSASNANRSRVRRRGLSSAASHFREHCCRSSASWVCSASCMRPDARTTASPRCSSSSVRSPSRISWSSNVCGAQPRSTAPSTHPTRSARMGVSGSAQRHIFRADSSDDACARCGRVVDNNEESVVTKISKRARAFRTSIGAFISEPGTPIDDQRTALDRTDKLPRPRGMDYRDAVIGGVSALVATPEKAPVERHILYLHGGGYVVGSPRSHIAVAARLALRARASASASVIDYRLAPEHPYPAAIDDCVAAYRAIIADRDPACVVIAGDSAGGGPRTGQSRPSTVTSASSTAHISSAASRPTRRPSRWASTAPTSSTSTRVVSPAIETSGRNEAGRTPRDVGATRITERGSIESDWTMTPKRSPCWSCPTPLGTLKRKTSPRCTHRLHHRRDRQYLGSVGFIGFQRGGLGRELTSLPHPLRRGEQGRTDRRGPAQTGRLQDAKRSLGIIIEAD